MASCPPSRPASARPRLDPVGLHRRIPLLPHMMTERITPARDLLVLSHLGVPRLSVDDWSMTIDGLVENPLRLTWADLAQFPSTSLEAVHECAGNPLAPRIPTRRAANVVWTGIDMRHVLERAGVRPEAKFLWSAGADWGPFEGEEVDAFVKDLPLERVREGGVLLAHAVNGEPLSPEHGHPLRLVVPGFYGTNSVKWLIGQTLADRRADGLFTTRYYNDDLGDGRTKPVWAIAPESVIVSPAPDAVVPPGRIAVSGWAWGERPIRRVDVSADGGRTWLGADVEPRSGRAWQAFRSEIALPDAAGTILASRATDEAGESQPGTGARNAVHDVHVAIARPLPHPAPQE